MKWVPHMPPSPTRRISSKALSSRALATATPANPRAARPSRVAEPVTDPRVKVQPSGVTGLQERRRRRRAHVPPMYSSAIVRVLTQRGEPLEGHVLDLSETGMAVQLDSLIPVGQAVTIEFRVAGLGRLSDDQWTEFAAAAIVVRHDDLDDFPHGPFKIALRFVRIGTMAQAQIARFVATTAA
jgi:c-di-GMP-binding flagellar brake protein YcgR